MPLHCDGCRGWKLCALGGEFGHDFALMKLNWAIVQLG
jgi:hypothetical protein